MGISVNRRAKGFTLVELLVVIGIISLLISILLPSLARARQSAVKVACQSNMRQLGLAFVQYVNDTRAYPTAAWPSAISPYLGGRLMGDADLPDSEDNLDRVSPINLIHCPAVPVEHYTAGYGMTKITLTYSMAGMRFVPGGPWWAVFSIGGQQNPGITPRIRPVQIVNPSQFALLTENWHTKQPYQSAWATAWWRQYAVNDFSLLFVHGDASNVLFTDGHVESVRYSPAISPGNFTTDTYVGFKKLTDQSDALFQHDSGFIRQGKRLPSKYLQ